ncbi:hypothetical protein [Paludisphaera soli]|uniref:hypothetical protein n=1 Tax=Paludisphaera soli TaxID=2712865 RepID=UPI0013EC42CA|nr:hypothetical protein [Paludisphaera soli]
MGEKPMRIVFHAIAGGDEFCIYTNRSDPPGPLEVGEAIVYIHMTSRPDPPHHRSPPKDVFTCVRENTGDSPEKSRSTKFRRLFGYTARDAVVEAGYALKPPPKLDRVPGPRLIHSYEVPGQDPPARPRGPSGPGPRTAARDESVGDPGGTS